MSKPSTIARALLPSIAAILSCTPPANPVHVVPVPALSAPRPSPSADAVAKPDLCRTAGAAEFARIRTTFEAAKKQARAAKPEGGFNPLPDDLPTLFTKCFSHPDGAWLVTLDWMKPGGQWGPSIDARWSLTHVDHNGARLSITPSETRDDATNVKVQNLLVGGEDTLTAELHAFDYDRDGVPEILTLLSGRQHEGAAFRRGRVYTFKSGAIAIYPPAKDIIIDSIHDADGDHRPDLVTKAGYTANATACGSGFDYTLTGPDLLAHAQPDGTFSLTDDVAIRAARTACPKPPSPIVPAGDEGNTHTIADNIVCARIWSEGSSAVLTELDSACKRFAGSSDCKAGDCPERSTLDAWARATPPLSLTRTPAGPRP